MRRRVVSAAMAALSGVILAAALMHAPLNPFPLRWFTALSLTFGVVLFAISVLLFLSVVAIAWVFVKGFKTDLSQVRGD